MIRKDKLKVIHNALKLIVPDKEYDLSNYDIIHFNRAKSGYTQVFSINRLIYVESTLDIPFEITALFELHKVSDKEFIDVYEIIEKNDTLWSTIGTPCTDVDLYKAIPIDKNLFRSSYEKGR